MTTQEKINAIVEKYKKMGAKISDEQLLIMAIKMVEKEESAVNGLISVTVSKKSSAKWASRQRVSEMKFEGNASAWLAAKNRENAMNNLPSSMR